MIRPVSFNTHEQQSAPSHLSENAARLWNDIVSRFILETHHLHLLLIACESVDRKAAALATLEKEGLTVLDFKGTPRPHPCTSIARDSGIQYMRAIRELNLDVPASEDRPPSGRHSAPPRR